MPTGYFKWMFLASVDHVCLGYWFSSIDSEMLTCGACCCLSLSIFGCERVKDCNLGVLGVGLSRLSRWTWLDWVWRYRIHGKWMSWAGPSDIHRASIEDVEQQEAFEEKKEELFFSPLILFFPSPHCGSLFSQHCTLLSLPNPHLDLLGPVNTSDIEDLPSLSNYCTFYCTSALPHKNCIVTNLSRGNYTSGDWMQTRQNYCR